MCDIVLELLLLFIKANNDMIMLYFFWLQPQPNALPTSIGQYVLFGCTVRADENP